MVYFSRLKAGEERAFDYFFNRYYSGLCVFANKFLRDPHSAEETVQNVFLKLWKNRNTIEVNVSVRAYLFTSVKNQCLDALKHTKISKECFDKLAMSLPGSNNETWDAYVESELIELLAEAQNELDNRAECVKYIQVVRNRSNLPDREAEFAGSSKEQMREQIAHERLLELAIEGKRCDDLIRWGWFYDGNKLAELISLDDEFSTWLPGHEYLPIPQNELDVNPNLSKNSAN